MSSIAIITARGGSKRIPRKNIRDFCGRPILLYSIEAALQAGVFDTVMVSTDDEEIAHIARDAGAAVPFLRSEKTSDDFATTADVLLEVLDRYAERGETFTTGCCIYPTAPFVTAKKLCDGMHRLSETGADSLIPVVRFSYPVQRGMVIRAAGASGNDKASDGTATGADSAAGLVRLVFAQPEYLNARSQDLEPYYHDVGQFYCFKVDSFRKNRHMMVGHVIPLEVPETEVQDIDNETDWKLAELKYRLMKDVSAP